MPFSTDNRSNLHRPPDPPLHGFCLLEGSQEHSARALRTVYRAADAAAGQGNPRRLCEAVNGAKYPAIAQELYCNWGS